MRKKEVESEMEEEEEKVVSVAKKHQKSETCGEIEKKRKKRLIL